MEVDESSTEISLIDTAATQSSSEDVQLDKYLQRLELFLRFFGFCHYSPLSFTLSWLSFLAIGLAVPFLIIEFSYCSDCEKYQIRVFELEIFVCQSLLAAISLLCISHNLRKYGVRRLLFVDRYRGHMAQFRDLYIHKIHLYYIDSQPMMEETILVGDDLMMGPPSPLIPPEIASHVLEGVDLCDGILRNLFLCLQINDIEPFCQDEIALYRQCAEKRDKELRERLQDSERKLGSTMPLDEANERAAQLESEVTSLDRRLILASGIEGMDGFRQRWSLHGRLTDTKRRLEALKMGMEKRKKDEPVVGVVGGSTTKKWFFW
ncbi:unnamed protein product [Camellia sinensis]